MNLTKFGESILQCNVNISKRVNEGENATVQVYLCALLNSGGGILQLCNTAACRDNTNIKSFDTWWSGIEQQIRWLISQDDICNYVDLVGSYDDEYLYVFVKSSDHVCTVNYHARVPTDTATLSMSYHTAVKLMREEGEKIGRLSDLPGYPDRFEYGEPMADLRQETAQIQFKYLSSERDLSTEPVSERIGWFVRRYVSAFANYRGGHVLFGIEDRNSLVCGEDIPDPLTLEDVVAQVTERMSKTIWVKPEIRVQRGIHWDVAIYPVDGVPSGVSTSRFVIIVSIVRYPGLVHTQPPETYHIVDGKVKQMSPIDWRSNIIRQIRDIDEMKYKYHRLEMHNPGSLPVYMIQDFVTEIKERHFTVSQENLLVYPKQHRSLQKSSSLSPWKWLNDNASAVSWTGISLVLDSWTLHLPACAAPKPVEYIGDALLLTTAGIFLITLVEGAVTDESREYSVSLGKILKRKLVMEGGCREKFNVICHTLPYTDSFAETHWHELRQSAKSVPGYRVTKAKLEHILHALIVTVATFPPITTDFRQKDEFLLTLSQQQFELLWQHHHHKELWVCGPPGSGKTVAAVEFVRKLLRCGSTADEILYICEHKLLCEKIRSLHLCKAVCRRDFLADAAPNGCYGNIKNIIIDEAQNFKDRDGDWYRAAQRFVKNGDDGASCHGYLWAFVDTDMQVHKFRTGVPDLAKKTTFELKQILRSSGDLFGFASKFLDTETDSAGVEVTNASPGDQVKFIPCSSDSFKEVLPRIVEQYSEHGYRAKDVAILFSKRKDVDLCRDLPTEARVTSVKLFSGLDRPVVIGVHPRVNAATADYNKFMLSLISRASSRLVIVTPDDSEKCALQDLYYSDGSDTSQSDLCESEGSK